MGRTPEDWDIASSARPERIMEIFGEKAIPTGLRHGTVTVKARDGLYEITTFRTEGTYSDGRHPDTVSFSSSIEEDLSRRDLTINAMAMDDDGRVIDPFGGQKDSALRRIRCVGDPRKDLTRTPCAYCGPSALHPCCNLPSTRPRWRPCTQGQGC